MGRFARTVRSSFSHLRPPAHSVDNHDDHTPPISAGGSNSDGADLINLRSDLNMPVVNKNVFKLISSEVARQFADHFLRWLVFILVRGPTATANSIFATETILALLTLSHTGRYFDHDAS